MSLPTFLFYCANVLLGVSYLVIAALSFQPGGITGKQQQTRFQRNVAVAFFLSGALLHADLAWHAFTLRPFLNPAGSVEWDLAVIIFFQAITVVVSLASIRRDKQRARRDSP